MNQIGAARTWLLAFVLVAGGGFAALLGIGCAVGANACPFRDAPKQTSTDGRTLWFANCAACHGPAGAGGRGPSLVTGPSAALEGAELVAKIARGKPFAGMPRYSRILTAEQIEAVAQFAESLRGASTPTPSPAPSPQGAQP